MEIIRSVRDTAHFLGLCPKCNIPSRVTLEGRSGYTATLTCPEDGTTFTGKRLAAVTTEDHCDARCMGAVGPNCSCGCGGANHGVYWTIAGVRKRTSERFADAVAERLAKLAKLEEQRNKRAAAKAAQTRKVNAAWRAEHADVVAFLADDENLGNSDFMWSQRDNLRNYGTLTERQVDAVRRSITRVTEWKAARAKADAERAVKLEKGAPMPTGRVEITGRIIGAKWVEDDYSRYGGMILKITVETADGWRAYGTAPSDLKPNRWSAADAERCFDLKGKDVTFTATLKPSKGEPETFGIFSRPVKGKILATA